jgi:hypothetical protein
VTTPVRTGGGKAIEVGASAANITTSTFDCTGDNRAVFAVAFSGHGGGPSLPTSVVWDPTGANEDMPLIQSVATWDTFWRAAIYGKIGPTSGAAKGVKATWAAAQDEGLLIAEGFNTVDQTTSYRTPDTPGAGSSLASPFTPTLAVTSVSGDLVLAFLAASDQTNELTTLSSSTVTVHDKLEGAEGTNNEQSAAGSVVATGTSTTVDFTCQRSGTGASAFWRVFGLSLIGASSGGGGLAWIRA